MNSLHKQSVVADTHNDLLSAVVVRPVDDWSTFFREQWLPQLREGGVNVQVLPVYVDTAYYPEAALRQTLRMIEAAHRLAAGNAHAVEVCHNGADIETALSAGRIALVLALEGVPAVGENIELLETLHRLGVRIASLAHFGRTSLADGSGEDAAGSRLTRLGVAAIAEMERLGILLDVSHLSAAGVDHVLEVSTRPVIATHSSARALLDHHRNLTDEQLRGVAKSGGVVCVNFFAPYLHREDQTIDRLIDHIEHIVSVAGWAHVGLGPDFVKEMLADTRAPASVRTTVEGVPADQYLPGLEGPAGLPLVTEALQRRGWSDQQITAVLGENVRRLFYAELGRLGGLR